MSISSLQASGLSRQTRMVIAIVIDLRISCDHLRGFGQEHNRLNFSLQYRTRSARYSGALTSIPILRRAVAGWARFCLFSRPSSARAANDELGAVAPRFVHLTKEVVFEDLLTAVTRTLRK